MLLSLQCTRNHNGILLDDVTEILPVFDAGAIADILSGLMQKRRNSIANMLGLRLFCIKSSECSHNRSSIFPIHSAAVQRWCYM